MLQKKLLYVFVLFLSIQDIVAKIPLCISLGAACGPALTLRDLKLRAEAYPFDWVISPFDSLYKALEDDFEFFLTDLQLRPDQTGIIDYYGFHFTHDLPTVHNQTFNVLETDFTGNCTLYHQWENALPLVREKYQRRIKRFRNVCRGKEKVFFIRSETNKAEALLLRDFFKTKYPQLDFVLIVFSSDPSFAQFWNIPHIINFHSLQWYDPVGWGTMLQHSIPEFKDLITPRSIIVGGYSTNELWCLNCALNSDDAKSLQNHIEAVID